MNRNQSIALVLAAIVLIGAAVVYKLMHRAIPSLQYSNAAYHVAFSYPDTYTIQEHDSNDRHSVVVVDKTAASSTPQNGEGPTAITLDIYKNSKNLTPSRWVLTTPESNYELSPTGALASSTVKGKEAVAYLWSGLYNGESFVFTNRDYVYMFSVTYDSPDDKIVSDFNFLLKSVQFD